MNFIQRLRFLMGSNFKTVSSAIPTWRENRPIEPETSFVKLVQNGWRRNELIYACVSKKCNTASQTTLRVYAKKNDAEIEEHRLRMLLQHPNPRMSEFDFWYSVHLFQDFAGVAYYEKVRSRAGFTVQLWPMRPDWVKPLENSSGVVSTYDYGPPGIDPVQMKAEDVLAFPLFDPLNQYRGYPPVAVAAGTGDLDNAVTDYLRLLFQEGGVPPGILKTTKNITETIAHRAREIWKMYYGGYQKWTEPAVLGSDLEYKQTGLGVEQMGLELLDRRSEVRICMVLHVPPTVIHSLVGMERAILDNAQSFELGWWMDDLIPMYKNHNDTISTQLLPEFGEDVYTKWDFSEVPAVRAQMEELKKNALDAFGRGAITRNQYNEVAGLPNLGPRGDVYLVSAAMVEMPAGTLTLPATEEGNTTGKALPGPGDEKNTRPDEEQFTESQKKLEKGMTKFLDEQLVRIGDAVEETYANRKNGNHAHTTQAESD